MFRSVRRPSSGVGSRALYNYYLSIFLLLRIPVMWWYVFCMCALAPCLLVWCLDVYTSRHYTDRYITSIHVQTTYRHRCVHIQTPHWQVHHKYIRTENIPPHNWNAKKQKNWQVVIVEGTGTNSWWWLANRSKHVGFFKLVLVRITSIFNVYSFKWKLWKCFNCVHELVMDSKCSNMHGERIKISMSYSMQTEILLRKKLTAFCAAQTFVTYFKICPIKAVHIFRMYFIKVIFNTILTSISPKHARTLLS